MLQVYRREQPRHYARGVVAFGNDLPAISERAVAKHKIQTARCQVGCVYAGQPTHGDGGGHCLMRPLPSGAVDRNAKCRQAVDRGKDKGLCLPVVPSQTAEDADSFYNFLIGAQTEAVL